MTTDRSGRFDLGVTAALVAVVGAVLAREPIMLFAAVIPVALVVYAGSTTAPEVAVGIDRTLDPEKPLPGEAVTVSVTVTNEGEGTVPDLRVVDGVPGALPVIDGSPRLCTALRPGESHEFTYEVRARRGTHEFDDATVISRSIAGDERRRVDVSAPTELRCETVLEDVSLATRTIPYTGRVTTSTAGEGVEFYATRKYRSGDPMNRIDWNRLARTGELTTVEYREERSATVVVVLDAREAARIASDEDAPDAVDLGAYAAERAVLALTETGNRVGVAVLGAGDDWVDPGGGPELERRALTTLEDATAGTAARRGYTDGGRRVVELRERLPADAQVLLVSPATDDYPLVVARELVGAGHPTTVLSPDVTTSDSVGGRVVRLERTAIVRALRETGARVVEWSPQEPIDVAVEQAAERWS